ncbi:MAG TPA: c-type cytochrome [Candidatus Angelobacter sp.]
MKRIYAVLIFVAILISAGLLFSAAGQNFSDQGAAHPAILLVSDTKVGESPVASIVGPSWIKHLGVTVLQTRMGQMGGSLPVAPASGDPATVSLKSVMQRFLPAFRSRPGESEGILSEKFAASGADLYRWNCQSCHGPEGKGAEPEINSILGPVQGTSAKLTRDRMEARGIEADDEMVTQMSELAAASLRDRLQHGGKKMPAFDYLRSDEVDALIGYLEKLAGVPATKRDGLIVQESAARIGEHMVRGTCHICHDATGPGAGMGQGTIPSLASIPRDHSLSGMVHQVQYGSCTTMKLTGGEVMPAYPYFSEEEIAAAYFVAYSGGKPGNRQ